MSPRKKKPHKKPATSKKAPATRRPSAQSRRRPPAKKKRQSADTIMNTFVFGIAVFLALCAINLIGLTDYVEETKSTSVTYQVGDPESFFDALGPIAEDYADTGLYPSVMLAQAALESNFGESQLSFDYNNYFGIKAHGHHRSVRLATTEYYDGEETTIRDYFCVYSSPGDCFADYAEVITQNANYSAAVNAATPEEAARALQAGGYATDPNYASKVISVINEYNLTRFDPAKPSEESNSDTANKDEEADK